MKETIKLFGFILVICSLVTCGGHDPTEPPPDEPYIEQTHYGDTLTISGEQVWLRNYNANKISDAYNKYTGDDKDIIVLCAGGEPIGSGEIKDGIMNFTVEELESEHLFKWEASDPPDPLDGNYLKEAFQIIGEGIGWEVEIDDDTIKGNFILPETDSGALLRESVSGTNNSLSDETVYFIYVSGDCKITADQNEIESLSYTFNKFKLDLKKGWNTICYSQTYTVFGRSTFSMEIKNPDLKWVLFQTP